MNHTLTAINGIQVGHAQYAMPDTGCTVVLCPSGAVCGVAVHGAAPGTRETDLLRPGNAVQQIHAVLLTGGSAFGLAAADGVMQWLAEKGIGFPTHAMPVPIVPAAVLFDLQNATHARPDAALGRAACETASSQPVPRGRIGAGAGATVGKALGAPQPGGIGNALVQTAQGHTVTALIAVNAFGDVLDCHGEVLAGCRNDEGWARAWTLGLVNPSFGENTTIGVIATDAPISKEQANRLAFCAHDGLALSIRPVHTPMDGDTLFALSPHQATLDDRSFYCLCVAAVTAVAEAVRDAVKP